MTQLEEKYYTTVPAQLKKMADLLEKLYEDAHKSDEKSS